MPNSNFCITDFSRIVFFLFMDIIASLIKNLVELGLKFLDFLFTFPNNKFIINFLVIGFPWFLVGAFFFCVEDFIFPIKYYCVFSFLIVFLYNVNKKYWFNNLIAGLLLFFQKIIFFAFIFEYYNYY